ncbi:MAG: AAA family ATPase, partial [Methylococcaceae bacterium]|nr:AAA family ATPase [Methylococcaceae bacterium]
MRRTIQLLLTGHGEANMEILKGLVGQFPGVKIQSRVLNSQGEHFPDSSDFKADMLIHFLGVKAEMELEALAKQARQSRPITLIVYDRGMADAQLMRLAMQAGARDFIMGQKIVDDSLVAVRKILKEDFNDRTVSERSLTAVVNAKGGAGASTLACALAHAFVTREGLQTLLLDLDLQFGTQCLRLNLESPQGLMDALASIESLDEIALMGYVAKHASGLHVLNGPESEIILPGEIDEKRLKRLIELACKCYDHLVVDLPRQIDPVFNVILEQADHVMIVMQQDLSSVRDAHRMIHIMTQDLGLPLDRIMPILNRYERNNAFELREVESALASRSITVIPNDFKNLSTASNLGIPIADHAPNSPTTRAIQKLAETLGGKRHSVDQGMFRQFLSRLLSEA